MSEDSVELQVVQRHSRKIYVDPLLPAVQWGFIATACFSGLVISGLIQASVWVVASNGPLIGAAAFYYHKQKNEEMRAEVRRLMQRPRADPNVGSTVDEAS